MLTIRASPPASFSAPKAVLGIDYLFERLGTVYCTVSETEPNILYRPG